MAERLIGGALMVLAVSCGVKGKPVPMERVFPAPPSNLRGEVLPQGVRIWWTVPQRNSDDSILRDLEAMEVWRADLGSGACPTCGREFRRVGEVPYTYPEGAIVPRGRVHYLDGEVRPGLFAYRLVARTTRGIRGRPSQEIEVYWNMPPRGVEGLQAEAGDERVALRWQEVTALWDGTSVGEVAYQVFRGQRGMGFLGVPIHPSPLSVPEFLDTTVQNGVAYLYKVRAVRRVNGRWVPGPLSDALEALPRDLVPPEPPRGLVALPLEDAIRLVWQGGEQPDIAGYRVYRASSPEGPWLLLTDKALPSVLFDDRGVERGITYWYAVSALDDASPPNESRKSAPIKARLPD